MIHKLEGDRELTEGERGRLVEHDGEQFVCSDAVRCGGRRALVAEAGMD